MSPLLLRSARVAALGLLTLPVFAVLGPLKFSALHAQSALSSSLTGTILDPRGVALPGATVIVRNEGTGTVQKLISDGQGRFTVPGLPAGKYSVEVTANGFTPSRKAGVSLASGQPLDLPMALELGNVSEQVTVEAAASGSIAAALAPLDALLDATSARTEITQGYIQNFASPVADYGELVALAPGTFTTNGNGVGLGQSKTFFRGFPDGDYDIDYDGIPFYDTNSPTHHSWVFFPSQFIGGIDFDRSPGTASTIGPTPFGGSIHLLSRDLSPIQNMRGAVSYGSYNTFLFDGEYDTGSFLPNHKLSIEMDVHHLSSDGYQTFNYQRRTAGSLKAQYKLSDRTTISGLSAVVKLDANTPNFNSTRCQVYGVSATNAYSCTVSATSTALLPFTGSGLKFYLTDNSDPVNYLDYGYNQYHIPTDFEYVDVKHDFGHGITFDVKPYTYNYDNGEVYTNATPITDLTTINGSKTYNNLAIQPCNVAVVATAKKTGITTSALPCGVDKYNSYRKYGETLNVGAVSRYGVLRSGMWYEWARTDRHQYPSDPTNNYADQVLPNFAEQFWNNSFQPFAEYQVNATSRLKVTPGVKFAYNTISTKQYADNGTTIGNLCPLGANPVCKPFISNSGNYHAWLPSIDANYHIAKNWTAYGQLATGTIVPPSNVYDYYQTPTTLVPNPQLGTAPKQQRSTTYQAGTVLKLKRFTLDADFYRIRFQNSYSSYTDQTSDITTFYLQPSSVTKGFEAEGNMYIAHGVSVYLNATVGRAYYTGNVYTVCTTGTVGCATTTSAPLLTESAPNGLWVAQTPTDTEAEGITYQNKGFDLGFFNKRVGTLHLDDGAYHNQFAVNPFSVANLFFNYTIRSGSHFDQTKIKLSFNNIFNNTNLTSLSLKGSPLTQTIAANGTTYADSFNTLGAAPLNGGDTVSHLPERNVTLSVQFGFSPKR